MRMLLKPCARTPSSSASVIRGLPQEVSSTPVASRELPRFQPGCIAATAAIAAPAGGVDGEVLGDGPGPDPLCDGLGSPTPPVQATPLRVNAVGAALLPVQVPLKPNAADPFVASTALWATLTAVTCAPEALTVAFQAWLTVCPEGKAQPSRQPSSRSPRLVTVTLAVKPPGHWPAAA